MTTSGASIQNQSPLLTQDLQEFLLLLKANGFAVGMDTALKLERIARYIATDGHGVPYDFNVLHLLSPIICKNEQEQERLRFFYHEWRTLVNQPSPERTADSNQVTDALNIDQDSSRTVEAVAQRTRKQRRWFSLAGLVALVAQVFLLLYIDQQSVPEAAAIQSSNTWHQLARLLIAALALMPPILLIWFRRHRLRVLERRFSNRSMQTRTIRTQTAKRINFVGTSAQQSLQLLRQHRFVTGTRLDVPRTLRATIHSGGLPEIIFNERKLLPEHLILVERGSDHDHVRGVADLLEQRLNEANAPAVRFEYQQDPRVVRRWDYRQSRFGESINLKELAALYPGHRLILLGDAANLIDPLNGRPKDWLEALKIWPTRALLTVHPLYDDALIEQTLMDQGFFLANADTNGLAQLAEWVRANEGTDAARHTELSPYSLTPYPPLLREDPIRWLQQEPPEQVEQEPLLQQVKDYLGARTLEWFCACAVFPVLRPELTLHLGTMLHDRAGYPLGSEAGLMALARLPWFREGRMPDWLRRVAFNALPPEQKVKIRTALTEILLTAKASENSGMVLHVSDQTNALTAELLARQAANNPDSPMCEILFMDFMRGRTPPPLAVEAPDSFAKALGHQPSPWRIQVKQAKHKVEQWFSQASGKPVRLQLPTWMTGWEGAMWLVGGLMAWLLWMLDPWPWIKNTGQQFMGWLNQYLVSGVSYAAISLAGLLAIVAWLMRSRIPNRYFKLVKIMRRLFDVRLIFSLVSGYVKSLFRHFKMAGGSSNNLPQGKSHNFSIDLRIWPVLALLYGSSFWGIVWYPARLLEDQGISGFWLVLVGYSVSLLIFNLFYGIRLRGLGERPWDVMWFMLATGWSNVGLLIPLIHGEVVRVLILFYLSPLWAVILGAWLLNERINRLTAWMLTLGLGGAMITLWQDKITHTAIDAMDLMALSAGFAFALNSVMARRLHHLSALHKNQLALLGVMLMAGICILLLGEPIPQVSPSAWLGAIALGVFGFMFAGLSILYGVSHMPVQRSAVIMLFELIVGAASAWLLIDQAISGQVWLGGSIIVVAGLTAVFAAHQR